MPRIPLSRLDDWELVHEDQDIRGRMLLDRAGRPIGTIAEMLVDTRTEQIDAIVLDDGSEYALSELELVDGKPILLDGGSAQARDGAEAPTTRAEAPRQRRRLREGDDELIELVEEELSIQKRPVRAGGVVVRKEVVSEQRTIEVPALHEEVILERRRITPRRTDRPIGEDQTVGIMLHREEVTVEKVAMVREELTVGTQLQQRTAHVSETVRREELVVDADGELAIDRDDAGRERDEPRDLGPARERGRR